MTYHDEQAERMFPDMVKQDASYQDVYNKPSSYDRLMGYVKNSIHDTDPQTNDDKLANDISHDKEKAEKEGAKHYDTWDDWSEDQLKQSKEEFGEDYDFSAAEQLISEYADDSLVQLANQLKLHRHPGVLKFLDKLAKEMGF